MTTILSLVLRLLIHRKPQNNTKKRASEPWEGLTSPCWEGSVLPSPLELLWEGKQPPTHSHYQGVSRHRRLLQSALLERACMWGPWNELQMWARSGGSYMNCEYSAYMPSGLYPCVLFDSMVTVVFVSRKHIYWSLARHAVWLLCSIGWQCICFPCRLRAQGVLKGRMSANSVCYVAYCSELLCEVQSVIHLYLTMSFYSEYLL